MPGINNKKAPV